MPEPSVYTILQSQKGATQVARLLIALEELAGRLESVSGYDAGAQECSATQSCDELKGIRKSITGRRRQGTSLEFYSLQLPDPQAGPLPLFAGASEFDALQSAANHTSSKLHSKSERHNWRSWLMAPSHVVLVVEAAWLLLALVFKQDDPCAAAVQEHVFSQLSHQYVSEVLTGQAVVEHAAGLWAQALAEAACNLLRTAFPNTPELKDPKIQHLLHRQLRLWTTGLLPSDVGAQCLHSSSKVGPNDAAEHDTDDCAIASANNAASSRGTAPFASVKPGPLISAFMADKGIKPSALIRTTGPKLTNVTVTQQQLITVDATGQACPAVARQQQGTGKAAAAATCAQCAPQQQGSDTAGGLGSIEKVEELTPPGPAGRRQPNTSPDRVAAGTAHVSQNRKAQAAACVVAAASAAESYKRSKKAGSLAARKQSSVVQQQLRQLQGARGDMLKAGHAKVQSASNQIAGWLSEPSGVTTCVPQATTDAQCKAQRQMLQSHLRLGDWRMEHSFNAAIHNKCFDTAAAVAVLPTPSAPNGPAMHGCGSTGGSRRGGSGHRLDRPGGGWADIAGCSLVSNRLSNVRNGSGAGSSIKITKAAKAIVEDVQRKFAASPMVGAFDSSKKR